MTLFFIILTLLLLFGPTRKFLLSNWMIFVPLGLGLIASCTIAGHFAGQGAPPLVVLIMVLAGMGMFGGAISEIFRDWFGPRGRD